MSVTCRRSSKSIVFQFSRWADRNSIFCGEIVSAFSAAISFISPRHKDAARSAHFRAARRVFAEHSVKPRLDLPLAPVPHLGRKNGGQIFNSDGSALERGRFHFSVIIGSGMRHILSSCVNGGFKQTSFPLVPWGNAERQHPNKCCPSTLPLDLPPETAVIVREPGADYPLKNRKSTFYICRGHSCMPPVNELPGL